MNHTIYMNTEHGETVYMALGEIDGVARELHEVYGEDEAGTLKEFTRQFRDECIEIDLITTMNKKQSDTYEYESGWGETSRARSESPNQFMPGAVAIFDAALVIYNELNAIMTAAEAADEFNLSESAVRQAVNRGQIWGRKSGGTWLIRRRDAQSRWG